MVLVSTQEERTAKAYTTSFGREVPEARAARIGEKIARSGDYKSREGWKCVGIHVTGCQDAQYPYDLEIVKRFRKLDASLIPVFRKKVYRSPSGAEVVFPHHGLACFDENAEPIRSFQVMPMPPNCEWPRPTSMIRWFEAEYKPGSTLQKLGLPRPFVPYGEWIIKWIEETRDESRLEDKLRWAEEHGAAAQRRKEREHEESEAEYRGKSEIPYMKDQMSRFSEADWQEYKARMRGEVKDEPKPFVDAPQIAASASNPGTSPEGAA